jgi:hypothetical protein
MVAQDYSAAAQWGADQTILNTAGNVLKVGDRSAGDVSSTVLAGGGIDFNNPGNANQGELSKIDKANTVNIVAGAVNSQIVYQSTVQIIVPAGDVVVAQSTIGTNGGYVKLSGVLYMTTGGTAHPSISLWKGGVGGTLLAKADYLNLPGVPAGHTTFTIQSVDSSPNPVQQYTISVNPNGGATVYCDSISFITENAKV